MTNRLSVILSVCIRLHWFMLRRTRGFLRISTTQISFCKWTSFVWLVFFFLKWIIARKKINKTQFRDYTAQQLWLVPSLETIVETFTLGRYMKALRFFLFVWELVPSIADLLLRKAWAFSWWRRKLNVFMLLWNNAVNSKQHPTPLALISAKVERQYCFNWVPLPVPNYSAGIF